MTSPRLLDDIRNQPKSLARVLDYQLGEGRQALTDAAEAIRRARRVVLTGMGSSLFACVPLQYALVARGFLCDVVEAAELAHYLRGVAVDAAVVMISRSGESVEVRKTLDRVRISAAATIGITNEPQSWLANEARYPILVDSLPDEMVAIQTYTGTLLTVMLLAYMAGAGTESEWRAELDSALDALPRTITRYEQASGNWQEFLSGLSSVYLLARGPSRGSAQEGALLFNEVARTSSTAAGAGEFRHGPVEIVDEAFHGIVFAPQGVTRKLNAALGRDLCSFGGQIRVIGPSDGGSDGLYWETDPVPECVAPLVEIVPVQFAALRLAQLRGLAPGQFRYLRQVTVSESGFERP